MQNYLCKEFSGWGRPENAEAPELLLGGFTSSAPEGIRTPNLLIRSQMLYPLSYGRVARPPDRPRTL